MAVNVLVSALVIVGTTIDTTPLPQGNTTDIVASGLRITFGVVGALAVLYITLSGLRYVTSGGDPQKIAQAKNGIIYSLVGVAVAILAQAIVTFTVRNL